MTSFLLQLWWPITQWNLSDQRLIRGGRKTDGMSRQVSKKKKVSLNAFKLFFIMVVERFWKESQFPQVLQIVKVCLRNWSAFSPSASLRPICSFWLCHMFFCLNTSVLKNDLSCHIWSKYSLQTTFMLMQQFCIMMNDDKKKSCTVY